MCSGALIKHFYESELCARGDEIALERDEEISEILAEEGYSEQEG